MLVMNDISIGNYILLAYLNIIFLWATYKFMKPYKPDEEDKKCKCSK